MNTCGIMRAMGYKNDTGLPSVTDILSPWIDDSFYRKKHSDRGDAVHTSVGNILQKKFVPAYADPDVETYVMNFKQYVRPHLGGVVAIEERIANNDLGFCGQPDFIGIHGGQMALIDWKSSASKQWWWVLQLAGYSLLAQYKYPEIQIEKFLSISLQKYLDKPPLVVVESAHEIKFFQQIFLSQLKIWQMGGGRKWKKKS